MVLDGIEKSWLEGEYSSIDKIRKECKLIL